MSGEADHSLVFSLVKHHQYEQVSISCSDFIHRKLNIEVKFSDNERKVHCISPLRQSGIQ